MDKYIFITGAQGFLGRHCARYFASKKWHVIGLGHSSFSKNEWSTWGINHWYETDITLDALIQTASKHNVPQAIIHCAGSGSVAFSYEQPRKDFLQTVATTVDVLEFARLHSPHVAVLYPSSAAVYGTTTNQPITENTSLNPISPYGTHKVLAEQMCALYAKKWQIPVAIIRFFSLFGPELKKQLLWDACQKAQLQRFQFFGDGQEARDLLYIEDAVQLIDIMLKHANTMCPIVNGGTGRGISIKELLHFLGATLTTPQIPTFSGQARQGDPTHLIADITKAKNFGFMPATSWQEGIKNYAEWFFTVGGL